ncbi:MAG: hypothetical protein L6Q78_06865 [Bacteroidia bacterium]|nr:hypothetical protein [Bacteroidia bacterium]
MYSEISKLLKEGDIQLKATQDKICVPVVERIYKKMKLGIKFSGVQVCEGMIINGHHRYIASLLSGCSIENYPWEKAPSIDVVQWPNVTLIEEDWDTVAKLLKHNEDDAKYNDISIEELEELLK